jgi:uncharacterized membrane protein YheB (UPF0754 family)
MHIFEIAILVISSGLIGGFIGWITNNIAINMLFKKYWKWGGVIEAKYQDFIYNMSVLVEKDLVNGNTIKHEISSDEFKNVLTNCVEEIIKIELPQNSGNIVIKDISDIDKSAERIITLIDDIQPSVLNGLYKSLSNFQLQTFISQDQYSYFVKTNLKDVFLRKNYYEIKLQSLLASFLQDKSLNSIISDKAIMQISQNICSIIQNINFSKFDIELNSSFNDFLAAIDFDILIKKLENELSFFKISDFIDDPDKFSQDLFKRFSFFILSDNGRILLTNIITDIINGARGISLKLSDILSPSITNGIINFCKNKLPQILDKCADFIRSNKDEIETIVNKTAERVLDRSIFWSFINFIVSLFIDNLAGKFNIIKMINDNLKRYGDKLGVELSNNIINFIKSKTIGEITGLLQNSGILNASLLVNSVINNLKALENRNISIFNIVLDKHIGNISKYFDLDIVRTSLLPTLFENIKKTYIYTGRFKHDIINGIKNNTADIANRKLYSFFENMEFPIYLNENKIQEHLLGFWESFSKIKVLNIFGSNAHIPVIPKQAFADIFCKVKNYTLNSFYAFLQNNDIYGKASNGLIGILNANLDKILENNISGVVNKELQKLKPKEISDMVHNFMGKEMKAINILGAILGALFGVLSPFIFNKIMPNNALWLNVFSYCAVFCFVGIFTNWIAIKLLFRPYKALIKRFNFSPFIGIVASRKPQFAKEMGKFVKERMLGNDALEKYFNEKSDSIKKAFFEKISNNNYSLIDTFLNSENNISFSNTIYNYLIKYIINNSNKISKALLKRLNNIINNRKLYEHIHGFSKKIMEILKKADYPGIFSKLYDKEIKYKNLGIFKNIVEKYSYSSFDKILNFIIAKLSRDITLENVKMSLSRQNDKFISYIKKNSINSIAGTSMKNSIIKSLTNAILPLLYNLIDPIINKLEKEQFNPNKKLNEVFEGAIPRLFKETIKDIVKYIYKAIVDNRENIINEIKENMTGLKSLAKSKVEPIVDELLDTELPNYLNQKLHIFHQLADELLETRLRNLGFTDKSLDIETVKKTIRGVIESPHVQNGLSYFLTAILDEFLDQPLEVLLGILNIRHINDIIKKIEPLLSTAIDHLKNNLSNENVNLILAKTVKIVIVKSLGNIKISELLHNIDIEIELKKIINDLINNEQIINDVKGIISDILRNIGNNPAFYNDEILKNDLTRLIENSETIFAHFRETGETGIKKLLTGINQALTKDTKNVICKIIIDACVNSTGKNFSDMIHTIDIINVVKREIDNMQPKQIEELFNSFAKDYFNRIILYGWIGAFGGPASFFTEYLLQYFAK